MKSILNDVNRIEKAYDLFNSLIMACNLLDEQIISHGFAQAQYHALLKFNLALKTANAFIYRYGDPDGNR